MIDLLNYFFNSTIGIIIITSAVSALTAVKFNNILVQKYTGVQIIDEAITILLIALMVTISVLLVVTVFLGLINLVFNTGLLPTPEFLYFAQINSSNI